MGTIAYLWLHQDDEDLRQRRLRSFSQQVDTIYVFAVVLAMIGMIISLLSAIATLFFRADRVISMAQPPFLYLICLACLLMASSLYFTAITIFNSFSHEKKTDSQREQDNKILNAACVSQVWLKYMGSLILYSALFSKLWRVDKVCSSQFRRTEVRVRNVIIPLLTILIVGCAVLAAWTVDNPPTFESLASEPSSSTSATKRRIRIGFCTRHPIYNTFMITLIELSAIGALLMACKTQHLREEISDSRLVQKTLFAHVIISLLSLIVVHGGYYIQKSSLLTISVVLAEFFTATIPLFFLIVPKIFSAVYKWRTGELPNGIRLVGGKVQITGLAAATETYIMGQHGPSSAEEPLVLDKTLSLCCSLAESSQRQLNSN
jgi:hypothetical protein